MRSKRAGGWKYTRTASGAMAGRALPTMITFVPPQPLTTAAASTARRNQPNRFINEYLSHLAGEQVSATVRHFNAAPGHSPAWLAERLHFPDCALNARGR